MTANMPEPNNHSNVSAWQLIDLTESRLAAFEGHKKDLLTNLRDAYEGGPKPEPFDTDKSWHDLRDVAGAYFWWVMLNPSNEKARVKLLRELAHLLDKAHELAREFFIDDDEFRREWFAQTRTPVVSYDEVDEDDEELPDPMKEVAASFETFARVARRIADYPNLSGYLRDLYQVSGVGEQHKCFFSSRGKRQFLRRNHTSEVIGDRVKAALSSRSFFKIFLGNPVIVICPARGSSFKRK